MDAQGLLLEVKGVPVVESDSGKFESLDPVEECIEPSMNHYVACALGPFLGTPSVAREAARQVARSWWRVINASFIGRSGKFQCLGGCMEYTQPPLSLRKEWLPERRCADVERFSTYSDTKEYKSYVQGCAEGSSSSSSSSGSSELRCTADSCEFHAMAAAHILCSKPLPHRFEAFCGSSCFSELREDLKRTLAGVSLPARPHITARGALLLSYGRRDFPSNVGGGGADGAPSFPSGEGAVQIEDGGRIITGDSCLGMGSPNRPAFKGELSAKSPALVGKDGEIDLSKAFRRLNF